MNRRREAHRRRSRSKWSRRSLPPACGNRAGSAGVITPEDKGRGNVIPDGEEPVFRRPCADINRSTFCYGRRIPRARAVHEPLLGAVGVDGEEIGGVGADVDGAVACHMGRRLDRAQGVENPVLSPSPESVVAVVVVGRVAGAPWAAPAKGLLAAFRLEGVGAPVNELDRVAVVGRGSARVVAEGSR